MLYPFAVGARSHIAWYFPKYNRQELESAETETKNSAKRNSLNDSFHKCQKGKETHDNLQTVSVWIIVYYLNLNKNYCGSKLKLIAVLYILYLKSDYWKELKKKNLT